jgi:hypothetical protein
MRIPEWRRLVQILVARRHLTPSVLAVGVAGFNLAATRLAAARLDNNGCPVADDLVIADASALLAPAGVPADTRSPTANPASCKAPTVARKDRRAPDDGDAEPVAGAASASHKRAKSIPASSPAATAASVSGSDTGTVRASDLSWLTENERAIIEHHDWSTDLRVCTPAVRIAETVDDDTTSPAVTVVPTPVAAPGPFGPLAGAGNYVPLPPGTASTRP